MLLTRLTAGLNQIAIRCDIVFEPLLLFSFCTGASYRTDINRMVNTRVLAIRQDIIKVRLNIHLTHETVAGLKKQASEAKSESDEMTRKLIEHGKRLADQDRIISEQGRKITEQGKLINDMNEKLLEYDEKFASLFSGLAKLQAPGSGRVGSTSHIANTAHCVAISAQALSGSTSRKRPSSSRKGAGQPVAVKKSRSP